MTIKRKGRQFWSVSNSTKIQVAPDLVGTVVFANRHMETMLEANVGEQKQNDKSQNNSTAPKT